MAQFATVGFFSGSNNRRDCEYAIETLWSMGNDYECSPLSCNSKACELKVNQFCLFETEQEAFEGARLFSVVKLNPGRTWCWRSIVRHDPKLITFK